MFDFAAIIAFLSLVYIRPQEWIPGIASLRPAMLTMVWAVAAMVFRSTPRPVGVRDLFRTPHDFAMWAFMIWMAIASPPALTTFNENKNFLIFYLATVNILTDRDRIERFLWWWMAMILFICLLGVGVVLGFDPTNAKSTMEGVMKGRLVLGMSIFNNPNALGHGIAPLAPIVYYLMVWRRPLALRGLALALLPLPAVSIYLTESKGGYIAAAFALAGGVVFGRPRIVQVILIVLAANIGGAVVYRLPRMEVMKGGGASAREEGVAGRVFAFRYGWDVYHRGTRGLGKDNFAESIGRERRWRISPHSVYVQVGAELGATGLFLYLCILYFSMKSLCLATCGSEQEERIRRALMGVFLAFCMSGWLITFTYRAHFFFQAGIVAAFHRLLLRKGRDETEIEPQPAGFQSLIGRCEAPSPSPLYCTPQPGLFGKQQGYLAKVADVPARMPGIRKDWNRITVFDVVAMLAVNKAVLMMWSYIIRNV